MSRLAIVFGNGLGMAMNSEYFSLRTALQAVWNGSEYFEEDHKRLVVSAIPGLSAATFPESE